MLEPQTCAELLASFKQEAVKAEKISFVGVDGYDVYNTTAPFKWDGCEWIAGRVERREQELSVVRLFRKVDDLTYTVDLPEVQFERMQDPFVSIIGQELVIGGIQIDTNPLCPTEIINWRTCFFKGKSLSSMRLFAVSPNRMKDVRLGEISDGRVAVFTRPIVGKPEKGRIGYTLIDRLEDLNESVMENAPIDYDHFSTLEWGGVNEVHFLPSGKLGVLGHISYRSEDNCLHYHAMTFIHDPLSGLHTQPKLLLSRCMLPHGDSKRPDLKDVLFAGGLVRGKDGHARLYTGVSDCETWCAEVTDPFINEHPVQQSKN